MTVLRGDLLHLPDSRDSVTARTEKLQLNETSKGWVIREHVFASPNDRACAERFFTVLEAMLAERLVTQGRGRIRKDKAG
ncbi:hypothetical protein JZ751_010686 [Albula glossodonta]|uniref:Uncharacterized protein n=1 Tax=Albula glossodonta TaxID=121402 RepID=A0A8T2N1E0_9TELE|nr:hypothetical protein JZ751_010686 [Albula glossodonta]